MTRHLRLFSSSLLFLVAGAISAGAQEQPPSLRLGFRIEGTLGGGQLKAYTIGLKAGQIAPVVAEQTGIDAVVSVIAPDGTKLFEVDSPNNPIGWAAEEIATIDARQSGL
jgi:hypothetical protein